MHFGQKYQAIQEEGTITITTKADKENIVINIQDDGIGMSEETQQRIFDPFFTTKDVGSGVGLGMSIVFGIIQKHNGSIRVKSEVGKGSEFSLHIPLNVDLK